MAFPEQAVSKGEPRLSVGQLTHAAFDAGGIFSYRWAMIDAANDDYEETNYGPSLAIPPLYVLRTAVHCPECGQAQHVYALGCAAYQDADHGRPLAMFHFLSRIESVPPSVLALLRAKAPRFTFDHIEEGETPYLMNHCPCGAMLDDDFVAGDVGAAFWPDTPEGFGDFRLFRLPVAESIAVDCSYTVGGGEYLSIDQAEAW